MLQIPQVSIKDVTYLVWSKNSCGLQIVVFQQPAQAFIAADSWELLGLDVELVPLEDISAFLEQIIYNREPEKPFDAFPSLWSFFGSEVGNYYRGYLADEQAYLAYDNPEVDALFEQGGLETDPDFAAVR